MKTATVIQGGYRVGDLLHLIPFFNKMRNNYDRVIWYTGTYEQCAAALLTKAYNLETYCINDGFPMDLNSRKSFKQAIYNGGNKIEGDVFDNIECSFDMTGKDYSCLNYDNLCTNPIIDSNKYIVIQYDSVSFGKRMDSMNKISIPKGYDVYSVGAAKDKVFPGAIPFIDRPLEDVVRLMVNADYFIGIHSAMSCLNFYLKGKRGSVWHFMNGLLTFGKYNSDMIDYIGNSSEEFQKTIKIDR